MKSHFSAFSKLLLLAAVKTLHFRLKSFCWLFPVVQPLHRPYLAYDSKSVKPELSGVRRQLRIWGGEQGRERVVESPRKILPAESKSFNQELPMQGKWVLNKAEKEKKETASALHRVLLITAQKPLSSRNFKF